MKTHKNIKKLNEDLDLDAFEEKMVQLKAKLYKEATSAINSSEYTHDQIAELLGTSRTRITRIANMGENSLSIEFLSEIIFTLENKMPLKIAKNGFSHL